MSELHGVECLKLISRLSSVHVNLELGAQQVQCSEHVKGLALYRGIGMSFDIIVLLPRPYSVIRCLM